MKNYTSSVSTVPEKYTGERQHTCVLKPYFPPAWKNRSAKMSTIVIIVKSSLLMCWKIVDVGHS